MQFRGISDGVLSSLSADSMSRQVRKVRKRARNEPDIPDDNAFELPQEFRLTTSGEMFLVDDNEDDQNRIIIFGAEWALELLEDSDHLAVSSVFMSAR